MKKLKIYIENSVIGGYFDDEFKESTRKLFEYFEEEIYHPIISTHVIDELSGGAPQYVIDNLNKLNYDQYEITEEMIDLTEKYMDFKIVSEKYRADALHIAIATVIGVDVLVSWNFKHIVNLDKIKKFNAVNLVEKYNLLEIRTPKEVINYG
ncbi:MAG: hypothetical protein LBM96_11620 [Methanobrevibacter sp.]|jgi:hypothetical protein|nr:hypothetical protein [Candidatus Methanoflexus mossambicus]